MTPEQEKQLLQALYDRLFDAITYVPQGGGVNPFDKKETFIHFTKNEALQPSAFAGAWNPTNPNADLGASELFAKMVDKVSPMSLEWAPKDQSLAEAYKSIVEGMNEAKSARPSEAAIGAYDKAKAYLQKSEANPFTKAIVTGGLSDEYQAYLKNLQALTEAYTDYSSRYNTFVDDVVDAEAANDANAKKRAQREWNTDEKSLRREISNAQANLTAGNSKWVQMALDTMNTTINDAFARARDSAGRRWPTIVQCRHRRREMAPDLCQPDQLVRSERHGELLRADDFQQEQGGRQQHDHSRLHFRRRLQWRDLVGRGQVGGRVQEHTAPHERR